LLIIPTSKWFGRWWQKELMARCVLAADTRCAEALRGTVPIPKHCNQKEPDFADCAHEIIPGADTVIAPLHSKIVRANLWHLPESEQGEDFELKNRQKYGK
jgi:hypothetical protein